MENLSPGSVISICITCNLGLVTVASVIMSGWVKASRVGKLEEDVSKLMEKMSQLAAFNERLNAVEKGIEEIKAMIRLILSGTEKHDK